MERLLPRQSVASGGRQRGDCNADGAGTAAERLCFRQLRWSADVPVDLVEWRHCAAAAAATIRQQRAFLAAAVSVAVRCGRHTSAAATAAAAAARGHGATQHSVGGAGRRCAARGAPVRMRPSQLLRLLALAASRAKLPAPLQQWQFRQGARPIARAAAGHQGRTHRRRSTASHVCALQPRVASRSHAAARPPYRANGAGFPGRTQKSSWTNYLPTRPQSAHARVEKTTSAANFAERACPLSCNMGCGRRSGVSAAG
mmetsp:Transcript_8038/g.24232  ORF Transcript_8038/g.24232 Transcript_8038/m.24232 type:complete len:257 (-) Transcript_8038:6-776(-)